MEKHVPMKKYLCSDKGVEFMNIDCRLLAAKGVCNLE